MDISILEDLGLTQSEIKVYISLLELGSSTAGPILEKSKLQNSVVHRALNSLIEKGLVSFVLEGKRHIYQAANPDNFYNFMEEKKERFSQVLPELRQRQRMTVQKESAAVYKNLRGIKEVYRIMRETEGDEYLTFGGGYNVEKLMTTTWWMNHHRKRIDKKLPSRQVFDLTVQDIGKAINKLPMSKVKYLSQEFAQLTETVIVGNKVAISVFTGQAYSLLIEDTSVADSYKKHFELMWNIAKE